MKRSLEELLDDMNISEIKKQKKDCYAIIPKMYTQNEVDDLLQKQEKRMMKLFSDYMKELRSSTYNISLPPWQKV